MDVITVTNSAFHHSTGIAMFYDSYVANLMLGFLAFSEPGNFRHGARSPTDLVNWRP